MKDRNRNVAAQQYPVEMFHVPVFLTEYLPKLSSDAVKLFIYVAFAAGTRYRTELSEAGIEAKTGLTQERIETAKLELVTHRLLRCW